MERRLAAILAADVVGFSRLMEADEAGTMVTLKSRRKNVLDPLVAKHKGRIFKTTGDGVLLEFASAVNAVQCAVELQQGMAAANADVPEPRHIVLRVGINLGDVMVEGSDRYGDAVNIAARLEGIAEPGGILVSGTAYDYVKNKVDACFDDLGTQILKNIAEPVRVYRVAGTPRVFIAAAEAATTKPCIAVLPFVNMSRDAEQEDFVDGLTEDITTALSRISAFWVIARTSTFTYKGKSFDVKQIAKDLGAQYVLEGSARRSADRLRITAQLIGGASGRHIWAERYDRPLSDMFTIQDEITRCVCASTETQVHLAERQAADVGRSTNFKVRDLLARAMGKLLDQTPEAIMEASGLVEEAARIEPANPEVHRMRALAFVCRWDFDGSNPESVAEGLALARTALRMSPDHEYAHHAMAMAYSEAGQLDDAIAECNRGLEINPNCSQILVELGAYLGRAGRTEEAIETCRLGLRLNPRGPLNFWHRYNIAKAHLIAGSYQAAFEESRAVARSRPHIQSAAIWAASAAALNKMDEARMAIEECLAQRPDLAISNVVPGVMGRFARERDHQRLLTLLRKAGLPN
jgi:TolB-like protein